MYERAIQKVGGAFKLTVLVQKRVREIVRGASPLIPVTSDMSPIDIALREILEDKIGMDDMLLQGEGKEAADEEKAEAKGKKTKAKAKKKKEENGADEDE